MPITSNIFLERVTHHLRAGTRYAGAFSNERSRQTLICSIHAPVASPLRPSRAYTTLAHGAGSPPRSSHSVGSSRRSVSSHSAASPGRSAHGAESWPGKLFSVSTWFLVFVPWMHWHSIEGQEIKAISISDTFIVSFSYNMQLNLFVWVWQRPKYIFISSEPNEKQRPKNIFIALPLMV